LIEISIIKIGEKLILQYQIQSLLRFFKVNNEKQYQ
jgi:hypothetical protein